MGILRTRVGVSIVIAGLLVLLGDRLILQRSLAGPTPELTIRGDSLHYIEMAEQGPRVDRAHISMYRILVPYLASLLPFSAAVSLQVISYVSLFTCYLIALLTCARMGFPWFASVLGLFAVYSSPWHLYHYHNPYLIDAFALMTVFLMFFSLVIRSPITFLITGVLGVLARETTLCLVPAWVITKQRLKSALIILAAVAAAIIPRWDLIWTLKVMDALPLDGNAFSHIGQFRPMLSLAIDIFSSWGFLWWFSVLGMLLIPTPYVSLVFVSFVLLFLGGFLPAFFLAGPDTFRFFALLSPVILIGCVQLYSVLLQKRPALFRVLVPLLIAQLFTGMPTVVTPRESWVFRGAHYGEWLERMPGGIDASARWLLSSYGPRVLLVAAGTAISLWIAFLLRRELAQALQEKASGLVAICGRRMAGRVVMPPACHPHDGSAG